MNPPEEQAVSDEIDRLPPAARDTVTRPGMRKIPHEGPWFVETGRSTERLDGAIAARYATPRVAWTAILALMARESFSAMRRLATDEFWHYHDGAPLALLLLHPDGRDEEIVLGRDLAAGQHPQWRVPAGTWMGAAPVGDDDAWTLIGNTLAPGFEYEDYEPGERGALCAGYPGRAGQIERLTRHEHGPTNEPEVRNGMQPRDEPPTPPPALAFEELMGRTSEPESTALSVARFSLQAGATTLSSYNRTATEAIVVLAGRGTITIGNEVREVEAGSLTALPAGTPHAVLAVTQLSFLAITTPAFGPEEFVAVD